MPPSNRLSSSGETLGGALARLEVDLSFALALLDSRSFRTLVLDGRSVLNARMALDAGWLRIEASNSTITRDRVGHENDPACDFAELVSNAGLTTTGVGRRSIDAAEASARRLVLSLLTARPSDFARLLDLAPLVEVATYRVAMRAVTVLDERRRDVLAAMSAGAREASELLVNYRDLVDTMGRATLIGVDAGSPWLMGMARSFAWSSWTPSFPGSRERDLQSALIGARSASRFGPEVIDDYLKIFRRAEHPLIALDALLGLTAIGLRHSSARDALVHALDAEMAQLSERKALRPDLVALGYAAARRALRDGRLAKLDGRDLGVNAFDFDTSGEAPAFKFVAAAVEIPALEFVTMGLKPNQTTPDVARSRFAQAWVGDFVDLEGLPPTAFGRA